MKKAIIFLIAIFTIESGFAQTGSGKKNTINAASTIMWNNKPAATWNEATPIGNGRLGGMVFGGLMHERIQTNDDTFWSGGPREIQNTFASQYLPEIRKLILNDKTKEAQKLIDLQLLGPYNECFMPLADVLLEINDSLNVRNYRRELDLNKGVVTITYSQNGISFKREIFSSYPDQTIALRLTANKPNAINLSATLTSQVKYQTKVENDQVIIDGQAPSHAEPHYRGKIAPTYDSRGGMRFEGRLLVNQEGGKLSSEADKIVVKGSTSITILFSAATSFNGFSKNPYTEGKDEKALCSQYIDHVKSKSFEELYQRHVSDYSSLFGRVRVDLGNSPESLLALNERIKNYRKGSDPSLTALYFQFGRYLLISSSRPGTQPANLQGIWNNDMQPAWSSNWTLNCNAEINYWPVESANLSECHLPLIDMIREASTDGAKTAKNLYGARGWMAHHNLDIWRTTWPVGSTDGTGLWAIFQVGSAWLCQHIWDHYSFTLDKKFLADNYPLLKGATQFYLDNLQNDREGYLVTNPSESFENQYIKPNGEKGWVCMGAAQDMQIIRALFENTMKAADILGGEEVFKSEVEKSYVKLAPMKISPVTGRLQEWNDDWEPADPKTDQIGHSWGFVAGNLISLRGTPDLAKAFRKTIEYHQLGIIDNYCSWPAAFATMDWARFEEGDSLQRIIDQHFRTALSPNLTSYCKTMDMRVWQIDGNLGVTSAIAEMMLQSHAGEINLLPALPAKYPSGSVSGLRTRGACTVNIEWKNGNLVKAQINSDKGGTYTIRYKEKTRKVILKPGETLNVNGSLEI
jgi:alpha-L-fucosidase 2